MNDAPIIVKLTFPRDRSSLMCSLAALKKKKYSPIRFQDIGMSSNNPIYINESLTIDNSAILKAATRYKKENKIVAAYSFRGTVHVNADNKETPTPIT